MRELLQAGPAVIGSWINSDSPVVAELMAHAGFDYLCVDAEHSAVDVPQTQRLFQAIAAGRPECHPLVRLHGVDYALVKRYLDAGAHGVIAPLIRCREQVELLIEAVKYPPQGLRGVGFCRANRYGLDVAEHFREANDQIAVVLQIEHIDAVERIDDLLSVDGVDAVFIGPYDLTTSMGITARFDHPDYLVARDRILEACRRHGVTAGIHVTLPDPHAVAQRIAEGYGLIAYSLDITFLTTACARGLAAIRDATGGAPADASASNDTPG